MGYLCTTVTLQICDRRCADACDQDHAAAVTLVWAAAASAQDIAGTEDCTKTQGLDRRTGCLQANVNFLQRTMTRNALEAHRRLQAAEAEIVALKTTLAALRKQVDELQAARAFG